MIRVEHGDCMDALADGDPYLAFLARKAAPVTAVDDRVRALIRDMFETMYDARGVGLAANQVGLALRLCVIHVPGEELVTLVNPQIVRRSGTRECPGEGCLSLPGYRGDVPRSEKVVVKGLNRDGRRCLP